MRRLTRQETEALAEGTKVRVTWSGGNGPHWYSIHIDKWGNRRICSDRCSVTGEPLSVESVAAAGIGLEKPATILEVEE
jgi:hypothetical protein